MTSFYYQLQQLHWKGHILGEGKCMSCAKHNIRKCVPEMLSGVVGKKNFCENYFITTD